jgi:hypothetical protein
MLLGAGCASHGAGESVGEGHAHLTVTNVAELRSVRATPGFRVAVLGFEVVGDGGEGVFVLKSRSDVVVETDDIGYIIKGNDPSTRWERELTSKDVSVKWFGARGDGSTNDQLAVGTAVRVAQRLQGRLYVPAGQYKVDGVGKRASLSSVSITTDVGAAAKLSEFVPATGRTIIHYPTSLS